VDLLRIVRKTSIFRLRRGGAPDGYDGGLIRSPWLQAFISW